MKYVQKGVPRALVSEVMARGARFSSPHFSLCIQRDKKFKDTAFFSFVVPVKVSKKAVVRNLIKRRGRAIVRTLLSPSPLSCAGLFFVKKGAEVLKFSEMREEIVFLLKKATIIP
jgi:ribonuclease P protein component